MKNRVHILMATAAYITFNAHSLRSAEKPQDAEDIVGRNNNEAIFEYYQDIGRGIRQSRINRGSHLKELEIAALKTSRKNLVQEIRICNGVNIGLGIAGFLGGVSTGLGLFFKDKVLEIAGDAVSTVAAALFITTNCMQCCQNPREKDEEGYGNL